MTTTKASPDPAAEFPPHVLCEYTITPADPRFVWGGSYENCSLIWNSRWVTTSGIIGCREAPDFPADPTTAILLRRVNAVDGDARNRIVLDAQAGFVRRSMSDLHHHQSIWTARSGPLHLRWSGANVAKRLPGGSPAFDLDLQRGAHHHPVLEISDRALPDMTVDAGAAWEATEAARARAVPDLECAARPPRPWGQP